MNQKSIEQIIKHNAYPDVSSKAELIETHISWVILTQNYAFKMKKPIKYSFLSFSTLESRKMYCEKEVALNRRLTEDVYLAVLPVRKNNDVLSIGGTKGRIIDYTVQMRKLDNERRMDVLLQKRLVGTNHMEQIAGRLALFHTTTNKIEDKIIFSDFWLDFADILKIKDFISLHINNAAGQKIKEIVQFTKDFLTAHEERFHTRHHLGFTVDGHGDLHSRNIFLLDQPVIFDCIEFNDHFRHVDILDELAFFCMDIDSHQQGDLAINFLKKYQEHHPCFFNEEDQKLFLYYKLYRANVRMKVLALKAMQESANDKMTEKIKECASYLNLMEGYYSEMKQG